MSDEENKPFFLTRHLNKLRWVCLFTVFSLLIYLPYVHVYQTFLSAHAYDLLADSEKQVYDVMEVLTEPFVGPLPVESLSKIKGTTWSGSFWGLQLSDPLAALGQMAAGLTVYTPFLLTIIIPVLFTVLLGRFFCGWICPATLIYELNTNLAAVLHRLGFRMGTRHFDRKLKYYVLALGTVISAITGAVVFAGIYPPALIGRELYYAIALGGFGAGSVFFLLTLLFDLLVARRGFCRYVCPGGALYSLLGRFRLVRIKRQVSTCNDCAKCNAVCEFGLDPLRDNFGQECNNCTACISICPTDALLFTISTKDVDFQGPGHLGKQYKRKNES
jgi:ferredoxin-type protein NapH